MPHTTGAGPAQVPEQQHDILVLGAGLTGINTAHVLRSQLPHRSLAVLEARPVVGGTWSFFRYPGFRSDSYMTSFGLRWHPWPHRRKMADAADIARYLEDAVDTDGLRGLIRFNHRVTGLAWRSDEQRWRLDVDVEGEHRVLVANFVVSCTGYFAYDRAFEAAIPGLDDFGGQVVHPQWWPGDVDYAGKRIVVVGSGATAVTIVPALAETAASVTMVQRSPSFVSARAVSSWVDDVLRLLLPLSWAFWLCCWKDTLYELFITEFLLAFPAVGRRALTADAKKQLPAHVDADVHFNPAYNPVQQRLCLSPHGDFFRALHRDNCAIVTDTIATVARDAVVLRSGRRLDADMIVTATGLYFQLLSGLAPTVDGRPVDAGAHYAWRGCMLDSLPNMAFVMGYTTSSWTPGADLMARLVVRVLREMERSAATSVVPVFTPHKGQSSALAVDATSSYFVKAAERIPKVTNHGPWYGRKNLAKDTWALLFGDMREGMLYSGVQGKKDI